jgi:hypothetical protein
VEGVSYSSRPALTVLPQFVGTNTTRPTPQQRAVLVDFVGREYRAGRSLRELGELTGRSQTAIRGALDDAGVPRRPRGAYRVTAPGNEKTGRRSDMSIVSSTLNP